MKNILSFLSVAALAVVFGVACKPDFENCGAASKEKAETCQDPSNFKSENVCKWTDTAAADKKCDTAPDFPKGDVDACAVGKDDSTKCAKAATDLNATKDVSCYYKKDKSCIPFIKTKAAAAKP